MADPTTPLLVPAAKNPCCVVPVEQEPPAASTLLPSHRHHRRRNPLLSSDCFCSPFSLAALLILCVFLFFPTGFDVSLDRLPLDGLHISALPDPKLDISLSLKVKTLNRDFFGLDYCSLVVSIEYQGERLGSVSLEGGMLGAGDVSYVDAELKLDGISIMSDVSLDLMADIVRGGIPFDMVAEVHGLRLRLFRILIDAQVKLQRGDREYLTDGDLLMALRNLVPDSVPMNLVLLAFPL